MKKGLDNIIRTEKAIDIRVREDHGQSTIMV